MFMPNVATRAAASFMLAGLTLQHQIPESHRQPGLGSEWLHIVTTLGKWIDIGVEGLGTEDSLHLQRDGRKPCAEHPRVAAGQCRGSACCGISGKLPVPFTLMHGNISCHRSPTRRARRCRCWCLSTQGASLNAQNQCGIFNYTLHPASLVTSVICSRSRAKLRSVLVAVILRLGPWTKESFWLMTILVLAAGSCIWLSSPGKVAPAQYSR